MGPYETHGIAWIHIPPPNTRQRAYTRRIQAVADEAWMPCVMCMLNFNIQELLTYENNNSSVYVKVYNIIFNKNMKHDTCTCNLPTSALVVQKDNMCTYPTMPSTILFHVFCHISLEGKTKECDFPIINHFERWLQPTKIDSAWKLSPVGRLDRPLLDYRARPP